MANENPCLTCTIVKDPANCENKSCQVWRKWFIRRWEVLRIVNAPTVDAVEVVHGRWVKHRPKLEAMRAWHRQGIGKAMSENSIFWTCSCCEEWGTPRYNYCPNCGAKMDGGNEDV